MPNTSTSTDDIKKNIAILVKDIDQLPVFPAVGARLFKLLQDDNRDAKKISDVISTDPSLSAQILKVSNSAYYRRQNKISTLPHAVSMLGMAEVERMAMALCSSALSKTKLHPDLNIDLRDFTAHLIMTAQLSSKLICVFGFPLGIPAECYAISLLHDIGFLILALNFPERMIEAIRGSFQNDVPLRTQVKEIFGIVPAHLGAWLIAKWQLPKIFVETTLYQDGGIPKKMMMPEYLVTQHVADRLSRVFDVASPFEIVRDIEPLPPSIEAYIKKAGYKWDGDLIEHLKGQYYDEFYEMRSKVLMLLQATVTYEEKAPAFIVRQAKSLA